MKLAEPTVDFSPPAGASVPLTGALVLEFDDMHGDGTGRNFNHQMLTVTRWSHPGWEHDLLIARGDAHWDRPERYLGPGQLAGDLEWEPEQMAEGDFYTLPVANPARWGKNEINSQ